MSRRNLYMWWVSPRPSIRMLGLECLLPSSPTLGAEWNHGRETKNQSGHITCWPQRATYWHSMWLTLRIVVGEFSGRWDFPQLLFYSCAPWSSVTLTITSTRSTPRAKRVSMTIIKIIYIKQKAEASSQTNGSLQWILRSLWTTGYTAWLLCHATAWRGTHAKTFCFVLFLLLFFF